MSFFKLLQFTKFLLPSIVTWIPRKPHIVQLLDFFIAQGFFNDPQPGNPMTERWVFVPTVDNIAMPKPLFIKIHEPDSLIPIQGGLYIANAKTKPQVL